MKNRRSPFEDKSLGLTIRCPTCGEPMWLLGIGAGCFEACARFIHECDHNMYTHVTVWWSIDYTDEEQHAKTIYEICISEDPRKFRPVCAKMCGGLFSNVEYEGNCMIIKEYPCKCPLAGIPINRNNNVEGLKSPKDSTSLTEVLEK